LQIFAEHKSLPSIKMELKLMAEERKERREKSKEGMGRMTVSEAGRLGGERVRELIEEGKESEEQGKQSGSRSSGKSTSGSGGQSR
jgi:hypothetical protein